MALYKKRVFYLEYNWGLLQLEIDNITQQLTKSKKAVSKLTNEIEKQVQQSPAKQGGEEAKLR